MPTLPADLQMNCNKITKIKRVNCQCMFVHGILWFILVTAYPSSVVFIKYPTGKKHISALKQAGFKDMFSFYPLIVFQETVRFTKVGWCRYFT